jgi:hypothetical protein
MALCGQTVDQIEFGEHLRERTGLPVEPRMIPKYLEDSPDELEVCLTTSMVKRMFLAKV